MSTNLTDVNKDTRGAPRHHLLSLSSISQSIPPYLLRRSTTTEVRCGISVRDHSPTLTPHCFLFAQQESGSEPSMRNRIRNTIHASRILSSPYETQTQTQTMQSPPSMASHLPSPYWNDFKAPPYPTPPPDSPTSNNSSHMAPTYVQRWLGLHLVQSLPTRRGEK